MIEASGQRSVEEAEEMSPEDKYLEGVRNSRGGIPNDIELIFGLKRDVSFGEFIEGVKYAYPATDYAGFHVTDPNWYEEGRYQFGILDAALYTDLEGFLRKRGVLEEDQILRAYCAYSPNPGRHYRPESRSHMVIWVEGGELESWGQFVCLMIPDVETLVDLRSAPEYLENLREMNSSQKENIL